LPRDNSLHGQSTLNYKSIRNLTEINVADPYRRQSGSSDPPALPWQGELRTNFLFFLQRGWQSSYAMQLSPGGPRQASDDAVPHQKFSAGLTLGQVGRRSAAHRRDRPRFLDREKYLLVPTRRQVERGSPPGC